MIAKGLKATGRALEAIEDYATIVMVMMTLAPSKELVTALKAATQDTEDFLAGKFTNSDGSLDEESMGNVADKIIAIDPSLESLFVAESELPPSKLTLDELMSLLKTPATIQ